MERALRGRRVAECMEPVSLFTIRDLSQVREYSSDWDKVSWVPWKLWASQQRRAFNNPTNKCPYKYHIWLLIQSAVKEKLGVLIRNCHGGLGLDLKGHTLKAVTVWHLKDRNSWLGEVSGSGHPRRRLWGRNQTKARLARTQRARDPRQPKAWVGLVAGFL